MTRRTNESIIVVIPGSEGEKLAWRNLSLELVVDKVKNQGTVEEASEMVDAYGLLRLDRVGETDHATGIDDVEVYGDVNG